jgi:uncharacterized SAM-binding protein YcdF (DUF218 family)
MGLHETELLLSPPSTQPTHVKGGCLWRALIVCLFVLGGLWLIHASWLPLLYVFLDVRQQPHLADFIVILGGRANRPETAIELYRQGYAHRILASGDPPMVRSYLQILHSAGIPDEVILTNDRGTSTWNEAQQVLEILQQHGARSALVITDAVHTRRSEATYRHFQTGTPTAIQLTFIAAEEDFMKDNWWRDAEGIKFVTEEYGKLVYYCLHYGICSW